MPPPDGGDDPIGVGGPLEGLGVGGVVLGDEAVDGGLEVDERVERAALQPAPESLAKKPSTALSQEQDVGVKWKVKR